MEEFLWQSKPAVQKKLTSFDRIVTFSTTLASSIQYLPERDSVPEELAHPTKLRSYYSSFQKIIISTFGAASLGARPGISKPKIHMPSLSLKPEEEFRLVPTEGYLDCPNLNLLDDLKEAVFSEDGTFQFYGKPKTPLLAGPHQNSDQLWFKAPDEECLLISEGLDLQELIVTEFGLVCVPKTQEGPMLIFTETGGMKSVGPPIYKSDKATAFTGDFNARAIYLPNPPRLIYLSTGTAISSPILQPTLISQLLIPPYSCEPIVSPASQPSKAAKPQVCMATKNLAFSATASRAYILATSPNPEEASPPRLHTCRLSLHSPPTDQPQPPADPDLTGIPPLHVRAGPSSVPVPTHTVPTPSQPNTGNQHSTHNNTHNNNINNSSSKHRLQGLHTPLPQSAEGVCALLPGLLLVGTQTGQVLGVDETGTEVFSAVCVFGPRAAAAGSVGGVAAGVFGWVGGRSGAGRSGREGSLGREEGVSNRDKGGVEMGGEGEDEVPCGGRRSKREVRGGARVRVVCVQGNRTLRGLVVIWGSEMSVWAVGGLAKWMVKVWGDEPSSVAGGKNLILSGGIVLVRGEWIIYNFIKEQKNPKLNLYKLLI